MELFNLILNYIFAITTPFSHIGGYVTGGLIAFVCFKYWRKLNHEPLFFWLKIFIIYGLLRAIFSESMGIGYGVMLGYLAHWFLPFILGYAIYREKDLRNLMYSFLIVFGAIVFFSLLAYIGLFYKQIGRDVLVGHDNLLKGLRSHIAFGAICLLLSFLSLGLFNYFRFIKNKKMSILFGIATLVLGLTLFLTGSRGYYIAAFFSYLAFIIYIFMNKADWKVVMTSLMVGIITIVLLYNLIPPLRTRIKNTNLKSNNVVERLNLYKVALWEIKDRPIFGFGPGLAAKQDKYFKMLPVEMQDLKRHRHLHSFYLNLAADFGLIGLAIFGIIMFIVLKRLWLIYKQENHIVNFVSFGLFWGIIGIFIGDIFDTLLRGPGTAIEIFWLLGIVFRVSKEDQISKIKD